MSKVKILSENHLAFIRNFSTQNGHNLNPVLDAQDRHVISKEEIELPLFAEIKKLLSSVPYTDFERPAPWEPSK